MNDTSSPFKSPKPHSPRVSRTSRRQRVTAVLVGALIVGAAVFFGMRAYELGGGGNGGPLTSPTEVKNDGNQIITDSERSVTSVVKKVSPSVVSIITERQSESSFFTQQGAGTGVIVSSDGVVMTNNHVVNGSGAVSVILSNGTIHEDVEVIGSDPLNDIAFLKINDVSDLKPATLGNSSTARVGQEVVAIGNSLGQYQNTVTSGILSATGRPVTAQDGQSVESLTDLLQTDAAINPGNSGGPLLNLAGQVIGINTAVAEGAQGIGFAIPINATRGILKGVLAGRGIERAYLGVNYLPITPEVARFYELPVRDGAYVFSERDRGAVASGSPADEAGVENGDIITKINDQKIGPDGGLSSLIGQYAPGDTIELTLLRDGDTRTVRLTLAEYRN